MLTFSAKWRYRIALGCILVLWNHTKFTLLFMKVEKLILDIPGSRIYAPTCPPTLFVLINGWIFVLTAFKLYNCQNAIFLSARLQRNLLLRFFCTAPWLVLLQTKRIMFLYALLSTSFILSVKWAVSSWI